jgi:hypothetical protein
MESTSLVNVWVLDEPAPGGCPPRAALRLPNGPEPMIVSSLIGPKPHLPAQLTPMATEGKGPVPAACRASPVRRHRQRFPLCAALSSVEIDEPGWPRWQGEEAAHGSDAQPQEALGHYLQALEAEDPTTRSSPPWWETPSTSRTACRTRLVPWFHRRQGGACSGLRPANWGRRGTAAANGDGSGRPAGGGHGAAGIGRCRRLHELS